MTLLRLKVDEEAIIKDYYAKVKTSTITKKYGISLATLYRILDEHNVDRLSAKVGKDKWQEVCGLYLSGWRMDDIAEELGTSRQNIGRIVKVNGLSHKDTAKKPIAESKKMRQMLESVEKERKYHFPRIQLKGKWYIDVSILWGIECNAYKI